MPWISNAEYTQLIRENERARVGIEALDWLRAQVQKLSADLESERARNRDREDRLVDRVIVSKGVYPVVPPAERKAKTLSSAIPLTALEEAELKMYMASAVEHGYGEMVGKRMFERDRKKKLEPQADLSAYNDLPMITPLDEITDEFIDATEGAGEGQ